MTGVAWRLAAALAAMPCGWPAQAQQQLVVYTTPVAGLSYAEAASVWDRMHEGDALTLRAEADNAHDPRAVRVLWQGHALGYLPAAVNAPVADALALGRPLSARVRQLREHPNPRERLRVDILVALP